MSVFGELKRRNVLRVATAYLAAGWLVTEVAGSLFPVAGVPAWGLHLVMTAFAVGLLPLLLFSWRYELTAEGIKREKDLVRDQRGTYVTAKRLDSITIGLIVLTLLFILVDRLWLDTGPEQQAMPMATTQPADARAVGDGLHYMPNSIAVLPFVNMSDDPGNEYFSDGISEELLNLLSKIPELRVISRSSAFSYKGKNKRLDEISRELRVVHILEGSVRKAGNQVRITAQLIDARTDTHLWSETFDRDLQDIFAIQDEIAGAVTESLKLTLLGSAPVAPPTDAEAFNLYLQARYLNSQGTPESLERAIELYRQALAVAPEYARAWRSLAACYTNQANKGLRPQSESYALAREAIDTALAIDPDLAMAHAMLGMFAMAYDGDLAGAAPHLEHALSLEPTNAVLLSYASSLLLRLGRLEEAVAIRENDVNHDPLDPIGYNNLSWAYLLAGRLDDAAAAVHSLIMLAPDYGGAHETMGKVLLLKGENEAALESMLKERSEVWRLFGSAMAYHAVGRTGESDAALADLVEGYGADRAYHIAQVLAFRNEADASFAWLEKAARNKDTSLTYIAAEPMFSNLHDDPRWLPFLQQSGTDPERLASIEFTVELPRQAPLGAE